MDIGNISLSTPLEPEINGDGWYAQCSRCWTEINPTDLVCPNCRQLQDWSWLNILI